MLAPTSSGYANISAVNVTAGTMKYVLLGLSYGRYCGYTFSGTNNQITIEQVILAF